MSDSSSPPLPKRERPTHQSVANISLREVVLNRSSHNDVLKNGMVPWFPSPIDGWNEESQSFSPRHEASTIELFFDLWFVANLATFTQYHAITNRYTFWSYVAFFFVLWTSWFHVVCFDVRFTSDSVWERACKVVHFCSFAAFALVGYKFAPVAQHVQFATPHWIYRVLCFALLLSRAWLGLQYMMTAIICASQTHRRQRLVLPLALNAVLFLSVAAIMGGLFAGFTTVRRNLTDMLIGVYVALLIELIGTMTISMVWTRLSFKATHIGERLGLLGLIIIGEGVIGTTKTIVRTMGKDGPTYQASAQIFCIITILLFMWILYFDRVPRYRFGTVKQQFYMIIHLPFHLAVLGVVEGAQQLAQARYIYYSIVILVQKVRNSCNAQHLDGIALNKELSKTIQYFKLNESAEANQTLVSVYQQINFLGNISGVCSPANISNTTNLSEGFETPLSFWDFYRFTIGAMYQSFGVDIPPDTNGSAAATAVRSWRVVYMYFWSAIILLLVCYTIIRLLSDDEHGKGHWRSLSRYTALSVLSRVFMIAVAVVMLVLGSLNMMFLQSYIASSMLLPTVVFMLWIVCLCDRFGRWWRVRRMRRYQSVAVTEESTEYDSGRVGTDERDMRRVKRRG